MPIYTCNVTYERYVRYVYAMSFILDGAVIHVMIAQEEATRALCVYILLGWVRVRRCMKIQSFKSEAMIEKLD